MQDGEKGGGGEKCLSSLARQRNIAQLFSVSNNNKNFTDIKQLLAFLKILCSYPLFSLKKKGGGGRVKNQYGECKGNEFTACLWQFECHVYCRSYRAPSVPDTVIGHWIQY